MAAMNGCEELVMFLLDHTADPNIKDHVIHSIIIEINNSHVPFFSLHHIEWKPVFGFVSPEHHQGQCGPQLHFLVSVAESQQPRIVVLFVEDR